MNRKQKTMKFSLAALTALVLSACGTIQPEPYSQSEVTDRVVADRKAMYADQEPLTGPLTFHEAAARALKYNLDYRLKLMESALTQSLFEASRHEMLPKLMASAGYVSRNNDSGGRSIGIEDRIETLRPSTSQERNRDLANLDFSWSLLDFGVSYYRAQQKADQVLMAEERRRKVIQNVLQDVRNSYWRAQGAQQLIKKVDDLLARVNATLRTARSIEEKGLMPRAQVLAYQRALLDAVNLLTLRRQDLELAQAELSALLSLPPGTPLVLAEEAPQALPAMPGNLEELENLALEHRPELLEEWYRKRVTANDIKAAKALLWPNVSLDINAQQDSNRYLYNKQWIDTGVRVSFNLLRLLQLPSLERAQEDQGKTDDMRRMALSMAVLTQVRVGAQRYGLALSELKFAEESLRVDERLFDYAKASVKASFDPELEVVRAEARLLLSQYQRQASYSNAQAAWGRLYNSVGLDILPESIANHDVKTLAEEIKRTLQDWEKASFKTSSPAPAQPDQS